MRKLRRKIAIAMLAATAATVTTTSIPLVQAFAESQGTESLQIAGIPTVVSKPTMRTVDYDGTLQSIFDSSSGDGGTLSSGDMYYRVRGSDVWTTSVNLLEADVCDITVDYGYRKGDDYIWLGFVKGGVEKIELTEDMLDINCPSVVNYDGEAHPVTATLKSPYKLGGDAKLKIKYVDSKGIISENAPSEKGTYTVKAVVPLSIEKLNFKAGSVEIGTMRIVDGDIPEVTKQPAIHTFTYDGTSHTIFDYKTDGGTLSEGVMYYSFDQETWSSDLVYSSGDVIDVPLYYGYKNGKDYVKLGVVYGGIEKAVLTADMLDVDCPSTVIKVDGKKHGATVTLKDPYSLGEMAKLSVVYVDENGKESKLAPITAGTYTVKAVVPKDSRNFAAGSVVVGTIKLLKDVPKVTKAPVIHTEKYIGEIQSIFDSKNGDGGTLETGDMYYRELGTQNWSSSLNVMKTDVTQVTVEYGFKSGSEILKLGEVSGGVEKIDFTKDVIDAKLPKEAVIYDGKAHPVTVYLKDNMVPGGEGEIEVSYESEGGFISTEAPVEVGKYTVHVSVDDKATNFNEGSVAVGTFEIKYAETGWRTIEGKTYYYKDGKMLKGWQTIDGKRYWLDKDTGVMNTSDWYTTEYGNKYYVGEDGVMYTGWQTIDGKRYWFDKEVGRMQKNAWYTTEYGNKYYVGADGVMVTGWQTIGGKRYWFDKESGRMQKNAWYKTEYGNYYYVGADGVMVTGWQTIAGERYWFNNSGQMQKNKWYTTEYGNKYYVLSDGKAARNGTWKLTMENGSVKNCTFNSIGRLIKAV